MQRSRNGVPRRSESGRAMVPARDEARRQRRQRGHARLPCDRREAANLLESSEFTLDEKWSPSLRGPERGACLRYFFTQHAWSEVAETGFASMCAAERRGRRLRSPSASPSPSAVSAAAVGIADRRSYRSTATPAPAVPVTWQKLPAAAPRPDRRRTPIASTAAGRPSPSVAAFAGIESDGQPRSSSAGATRGFGFRSSDHRTMTALSTLLRAVIIGFGFGREWSICLRRRPLQ